MYWWKFFVRVAWGPRIEEIGDCARRLEECLRGLGRCDDVFKTWSAYLPGEEPFPIERDALQTWMLERIQSDDEYDPELGYSITLNGGQKKEDWVRLSVTCSSQSGYASCLNKCTLFLPGAGEAADRIIRTDALSGILSCLVRAWEPDWGYVTTREFDQLQGTHRTGLSVPFAGWLLYLCSARGTLPALPSAYRVIPIESDGNIIVTTEERFSADSEEHVESAQRLTRILYDAGMMSPIA